MSNRQPQAFVSSPAELTKAQQQAEQRVLDELEQRHIRLARLERSAYAPTPWRQLREVVTESDGVVVFGFGQLHVEVGTWRPDTGETGSGSGWYASAWNQIEAGIAIMASLPVLVAADAHVTEGVFAPDVWGEQVFGIRGSFGGLGIAARETLEAWCSAVVARARLDP